MLTGYVAGCKVRVSVVRLVGTYHVTRRSSPAMPDRWVESKGTGTNVPCGTATTPHVHLVPHGAQKLNTGITDLVERSAMKLRCDDHRERVIVDKKAITVHRDGGELCSSFWLVIGTQKFRPAEIARNVPAWRKRVRP